MENKLFRILKAGNHTKWQLVCFPYLGGYANSFFRLANLLPNSIEVVAVNLPGHGDCKNEPLKDINSVIDLCLREIGSIIKPNCVFLGHSMGGVIAYFLLQKMKKSITTPKCLILSACNPPSYFKTPYSNFASNELLEYLIYCGGIPTEILNEKKFLQEYLPVFRADFKILEDALLQKFKLLNIPAYFLWGENDKLVGVDLVSEWLNYFVNPIKIIPIKNGSHMFIQENPELITMCIKNIIKQL